MERCGLSTYRLANAGGKVGWVPTTGRRGTGFGTAGVKEELTDLQKGGDLLCREIGGMQDRRELSHHLGEKGIRQAMKWTGTPVFGRVWGGGEKKNWIRISTEGHSHRRGRRWRRGLEAREV